MASSSNYLAIGLANMGCMQRQGCSHQATGASHGNPLINFSRSVPCRGMMVVECWLTLSGSSLSCQETISEASLGELFLAASHCWVTSLSFGALGVNDVITAVLCVLIEYVTKFYYSRPRVTFPVALNNFKTGFTYGLFIDAFKLAS